MIVVDCIVDGEDWGDTTALEKLSQQSVMAVADILPDGVVGLKDESEVSVVFSSDDVVQGLNQQWRGQNKPTNVLSFAANEGDGPLSLLLGDIILAFETIKREAVEQDKRLEHHVMHLVIHGFLHLVGYDHIDENEAEIMEALETRALAKLGIADPYAST